MSSIQPLKVIPISAKEAPFHLLLIADPDKEKITSYLSASKCYLALSEKIIIGVFVLKESSNSTLELLNIAIDPKFQNQGYGTVLLQEVIKTAKANGAQKIKLGTGTFGYQLAYYQKAGFRVVRVEKDYFLKQYKDPIFEAGIQHKDRLILSLEL